MPTVRTNLMLSGDESRAQYYRERYLPRSKPEAERNRSQEEARRVRQADRVEARRGERAARFWAAIDRLVATGEKAPEATRAFAGDWPPPPDPLHALDMLPPGGSSS